MPKPILLPKLGNSVESCLVAAWLKQPGDTVSVGDAIASVETDKTTVEVVSTLSGTLMKHLVDVGDEVPVFAPIAFIDDGSGDAETATTANAPAVSPRARHVALAQGIEVGALMGSGPNGRIIERDVLAAQMATKSAETDAKKLTPVARAMVESGHYVASTPGSGQRGTITKHDLRPAKPEPTAPDSDEVQTVPLAGVRKVIAQRMRASLHTTAQLTLNAFANASAMLAYRKQLKASDEALGLRDITLNDLLMFAVARTLPQFPEVNATLEGDTITRSRGVHLGFAVDTPRGLLVPVIRNAHTRTLAGLASDARTCAAAARDGRIAPDQLTAGTFTVSNLGQFGIESFTPILNPPQVAILGVGGIALRPVQVDDEVRFVPHLSLSLTIDHQVLDGAIGARFLQELARNIAAFDLLLAL